MFLHKALHCRHPGCVGGTVLFLADTLSGSQQSCCCCVHIAHLHVLRTALTRLLHERNSSCCVWNQLLLHCHVIPSARLSVNPQHRKPSGLCPNVKRVVAVHLFHS